MSAFDPKWTSVAHSLCLFDPIRSVILTEAQMRLREFISLLGVLAAWPLAAQGQQAERMRRVGVLVGLAENDPEMKERLAGLRQGLEKFGWAEGSNRLSLCARGHSGPFARERTGRAAARRDHHAVD